MSVIEEELRRVITIPEYYTKYIDSSVSLLASPKQCCPFHKEDTPSFIYNPTTAKWRCYGACKFGGDVIALHQKKKKLRTRNEAIEDLCNLLGIDKLKRINVKSLINRKPTIDYDKIELEQLLSKLEAKKDVDIYCKMDEIMAYDLPLPDTIKELKKLYDSA